MVEKKDKNSTLKIVIIVIFALIFVIVGIVFVLGVVAGGVTTKMISKSKLNVYKTCEDYYKSEAVMYYDSHRVLYSIDSDVTILTDEIGECKPCNGYVIANAKENKYEAYLKCDNYTTDGFDEKLYNKAINK